MMEEVVIVGGVRTPFGKFGGILRDLPLVELGGILEKAYQQVQDIAVKTIEGSSTLKSFANLQQWITEQTKKPSQEK
jgi:acetyl-CoA acetyltransferase